MVDSAGERISSARVPVPVPVCQSARVPSQSVPPSTILSLSCLLPRCNQLHYIPYTAMYFNGVKCILSKMESTIQTSHIAVHWMYVRDKTQCSAQWYLARWIIVGQCSVSQQSLSLSLCGHSSSSSSTPTSNASWSFSFFPMAQNRAMFTTLL